MGIVLFPVSKNHYKFLYELLKERKPEQNISFKMPSYKEHCKFNDTKPYTEDYVIFNGQRLVGRIYIYKNKYPGLDLDTVGIHIKKEFRGQGYGRKALRKFKKTLYANISVNNIVSQKFFEKMGFKPLQITYVRNYPSKGRLKKNTKKKH
jgi:RimJ/RimL family protein N-acetyltransferase